MKNRTTASLLAFFLGGLGIHQFYLGKHIKGIFYVLFCWTLIPVFIGFIDFIILLAMDENRFQTKYNNVENGVKRPSKITSARIVSGIDKFLSEYPKATEESLNFTQNVLPTMTSAPELVGNKIQSFMYDQIKVSGMDEKDEIKEYLKNGLNFMPDNFDSSYAQIYFSTIVEEYIADEALDPDEINSLVVIANELGIEKYQNEEQIRLDYGFYVKNWEFDNGIFKEVPTDFIMNKNETCIYRNEQVELLEQKEVTNRINYAGPRARVKIMKGLSYNVGSYKYSTSKETKRLSKGVGTINITTKRILFKAGQKNTTIRLSAIVDLEPYSDGLMIFKSTGNPVILMDENGAELYQSINGAVRSLNG